MTSETKIVNIFSSDWRAGAWGGGGHVVGKDPGRLPEIEASTLRLMVRIVSTLIHHLLLGRAAQPMP
jgi:hypothetical protein